MVGGADYEEGGRAKERGRQESAGQGEMEGLVNGWHSLLAGAVAVGFLSGCRLSAPTCDTDLLPICACPCAAGTDADVTIELYGETVRAAGGRRCLTQLALSALHAVLRCIEALHDVEHCTLLRVRQHLIAIPNKALLSFPPHK